MFERFDDLLERRDGSRWHRGNASDGIRAILRSLVTTAARSAPIAWRSITPGAPDEQIVMTGLRSVIFACSFATVVHAQATELPPPPGKLVDVGGRRLHLLCSGQGAPTVILEAGASSFAIDWTLVQREVETTNRVCSYDRAGYGWSDSSTATTRATEAKDLNTLLRLAGERPPYVMVGASRGGLLIRAYALDYPTDVAGFVFLDPATEDRLFTMLNGEAVVIASLTPDQLRSALPRQAVSVPRRAPQTGAPFDRLPPEHYQVRLELDKRLIASTPSMVTPEFIGTFQENERALLARLLASRSSPPQPVFGSRPTVVLTRGDEKNAGREEVHAALAKLSTNSRHSVIAGTGHEIHLFAPSAVSEAISDVVRSIRSKTALPAR